MLSTVTDFLLKFIVVYFPAVFIIGCTNINRYSHYCYHLLPATVKKLIIIVWLFVLVLRVSTRGTLLFLLHALTVSKVYPFYVHESRLAVAKTNTPYVVYEEDVQLTTLTATIFS